MPRCQTYAPVGQCSLVFDEIRTAGSLCTIVNVAIKFQLRLVDLVWFYVLPSATLASSGATIYGSKYLSGAEYGT